VKTAAQVFGLAIVREMSDAVAEMSMIYSINQASMSG
jgi:hypothetical protein